MTDEIPMIVIGEPKEDNLNKLDDILDKIGKTNELERSKLKEYIENHPNSYIIIELLDELTEYEGAKNTFDNRYQIFRISRDLKQVGSPIYGEYLLTHDDISSLPHEYVEVSPDDIVRMHIDLRHKQGLVDDYLKWYPTKKNIRRILSDLMFNDVIMSYAVEDLFKDITDTKEWNEVMDPDDKVRVLRML